MNERAPSLFKGILLAVLLTGSAGVYAGNPVPKGTLSGRIVDRNGNAVTGASVTMDADDDDGLLAQPKPLVRSVTGPDGRFRLGPVEAVYRYRHDLRIHAEEFANQCIPGGTYSVYPGTDCDLGDIRMDRGRVFSGVVLDLDGKPRTGAAVLCEARRYYLGNSAWPVMAAYSMTTDADGRFRTPPMPVAFLGLTVRVPERQLPWVQRPIGPGGQETLPPIRLEKDVPISGVLRDEQGQPIAGDVIGAYGHHWLTFDRPVSDPMGQFVLHGFGPNPHFQLQICDSQHVLINWVVNGDASGLHWSDLRSSIETRGDNGKMPVRVKNLDIVMKSVAWIEGRAIDAETGNPVHLDKVIRCSFDRKPGGEIVLNGCTDTSFTQEESGEFRVPYGFPDEYHLTFMAAGYKDAEALTPMVKELQTVTGIVVKMQRTMEGSPRQIARQEITGTLTRHGRPIQSGWVGLWRMPHREPNLVNANMLRGRTTTSAPIVIASAPVLDGMYSLNVPYQDDAWYLVAEEPGQSLTQVGPIPLALNEHKKIDIVCTEGGSITGHVTGVPSEWAGQIWVVAFTKNTIQSETRVGADGYFVFKNLPPGEYGLKAGHDAFEDAEVPREHVAKEAFDIIADPSKRATVVKVRAGGESGDVELNLPSG